MANRTSLSEAIADDRDDSKSTASVNKGNFYAILMLLSNSTVDDLKEHLIRSKVAQKIQKENAFFSIIGDELTDK